MTKCPQCSKPLRELTRRCPTCQADLDLLVDFVSHLTGGLQRAENLTRAGELGEAVWAYLEILETDPDNKAARKQVGRVVTAVRQFDLSSPGRRMNVGLDPALPGWFSRNKVALCLGTAVVMFVLTFWAGVGVGAIFSRAPAVEHEAPNLIPEATSKDRLGP